MVGSSFLMVLQILKIFFPNSSQFSEKQTQAAHSNANKEHISSMISKNKTSIHGSLSLSWELLLEHSVVTCVTFRVEISLKILYNFFKLILLVSIFTSCVGPIVVYQNMLLEGSL